MSWQHRQERKNLRSFRISRSKRMQLKIFLFTHISYDITNKAWRVSLHCGPPLQTPSLSLALLMSKFGWSSSSECLIQPQTTVHTSAVTGALLGLPAAPNLFWGPRSWISELDPGPLEDAESNKLACIA